MHVSRTSSAVPSGKESSLETEEKVTSDRALRPPEAAPGAAAFTVGGTTPPPGRGSIRYGLGLCLFFIINYNTNKGEEQIQEEIKIRIFATPSERLYTFSTPMADCFY